MTRAGEGLQDPSLFKDFAVAIVLDLGIFKDIKSHMPQTKSTINSTSTAPSYSSTVGLSGARPVL